MLKALRTEKEAGDLLGTYLLQGWIMTDVICPVETCSFPLMRSKDGSLSFCTKHDELPNSSAKDNYKPKPAVEEKPKVEVDDLADELQIRRQRREQSSKASQLIGQKMLQRWALLNEHCPNESCYAVPLVRNPDTKQMYCVICENIILTEEEALQVEKNKKAKENAEKLDQEKRGQEKREREQREQEKREQEQRERKQREKEQEQQKQQQQQKPAHSPISPQFVEERKRQKINNTDNTSFVTPVNQYEPVVSDYFSSEIVVSTLSTKMNELTERIKRCNNPAELVDLFTAIKACAGAIQACVEAGQVCDNILL